MATIRMTEEEVAAHLAGLRKEPKKTQIPEYLTGPDVDQAINELKTYNSAKTEKAFQAEVVKLAKLNGWKVYHTWRSTRSPAGFPDLCMVRRGRLIFAELKTEMGKLTAEQDAWLGLLAEVAIATDFKVMALLWRPSDMPRIIEVLR